MAVNGAYLAMRARWSAQPFVRTYCYWVNEHIIPIQRKFDEQANAVGQETYERLCADAHPESDGSEFAESALDAGVSFYQTLVSLYQATMNLFAAGLFHLIEQQLANLTRDGAMETAVLDTQLANVTQYYREHLDVDLKAFCSWGVIDEMRLVANATKHGEGRSADDLRRIRPELFQYPALRRDNEDFVHFPLELPLGGEGLYITEEDFRRYENAANGLFDFVTIQFSNHANQYFPR